MGVRNPVKNNNVIMNYICISNRTFLSSRAALLGEGASQKLS